MKIGFIGCGNMASAMIGGIIKNQVVAPADSCLYELNGSYNCSAVEQEAGKAPLQNPRSVVGESFLQTGTRSSRKAFSRHTRICILCG